MPIKLLHNIDCENLATIINVPNPINNNDVATKQYVDTNSGSQLKYSTTIGDGINTTYTITHNFNTRDVKVSVYYNSGNYDEILCEVQRPSVDMVTVVFSTPPTSDQFRVMVLG